MGITKRDLTGMQFGALLVKEHLGIVHGRTSYLCTCVCGAEVIQAGAELERERAKDKKYCTRYCPERPPYLKYGDPSEIYSTEYISWAAMLGRCRQIHNIGYHRYGGRGITVCKRWHSYANFLADMGRKPSKEYSLERINNNLGYFPGNVKWGSREEQGNNQRTNRFFTYKGVRLTIAQWQRKTGLPVRSRLKQGWSFKAAITRPKKKY